MTKKLQKSSSKLPSKKSDMSLAEFKMMMGDSATIEDNPDRRLKKMMDVYTRSISLSGKDREEADKELNTFTEYAFNTLSLDTKSHLLGSVQSQDRGFAIEMTNQLKNEFGIKTPSEKSLVQLAVSAYIRYLGCARFFVNNMEGSMTHERANLIGKFSKESDRCFRQYLSALQTLQQLKTPPLRVNIKTQNAFVAQNQQNNSGNPNSANHENIDPQSFRKNPDGAVSENIPEGAAGTSQSSATKGDSEIKD